MKTYLVTIPIGGHVTVEVEAEDEKQAVEAALVKNLSTEDIDSATWETFERINSGNVCYFPLPWEAEAIEQ
jgi:hypothetical protein